MGKKVLLVVLIILIILAVVFFSPKQNNVLNDSFTGAINKQYTNMDCTCVGFVGLQPGLTRSDAQVKLCYGLPIDCKLTCRKQIDGNWQTVSCNS
ncbi:MAG: hypothetical protein WCI04_00645 [archaeon]